MKKIYGALSCLAVSTVVCVVIVVGAACGTAGSIDPSAVGPSISTVCDRHDAYVRADPTLSADEKATELRTTELLRRVVQEAQAAKK